MPKLVDYSFRIRADFNARFALPYDITAAEANKLAEFIFNIPLSVRIAMIQAVKDEQLTKMGKLADLLDTKSVK